MDGRERLGDRPRRDAETLGDRRRRTGRVGDELLVPHLDRALRDGPRRGDVPAPGPGGARRVGDLGELRLAAALDPEAGVGAVGEPRVVGAGPRGAQPAAREERRDDVPPVAHDVYRDRLGIGQQGGREDEARLRRLLDPAQPGREPEPPHALEDAPQPRGDDVVGKVEQPRDRGLPRLHLVEVDEPRQRAERAPRERRPRARRADDEDEALLAPQPAAAARDPHGAAAVQGGRRREVLGPDTAREVSPRTSRPARRCGPRSARGRAAQPARAGGGEQRVVRLRRRALRADEEQQVDARRRGADRRLRHRRAVRRRERLERVGHGGPAEAEAPQEREDAR